MTVNKEVASNFYYLVACLKASKDFAECLVKENDVSQLTKQRIKTVIATINNFEHLAIGGLPIEIKEMWEAEWQRDYLSIANILKHWIAMDDEKRDLFEDLAESVKNGDIRVELEPETK
jgi:hypothetical protein